MRKKDNKDKKHCNKKIVIILLITGTMRSEVPYRRSIP